MQKWLQKLSPLEPIEDLVDLTVELHPLTDEEAVRVIQILEKQKTFGYPKLDPDTGTLKVTYYTTQLNENIIINALQENGFQLRKPEVQVKPSKERQVSHLGCFLLLFILALVMWSFLM